MGKMADTVLKNQKEAELALERAILKQEEERIEKQVREEEKKKLQNFEKNRKLQQELHNQLSYKQRQKREENSSNALYMQQWTAQVEREAQMRKSKEEEMKRKRFENQLFLKEQMERDAEPLATSMTIKKPPAIGYVK